jgi:acyl carrier protein phosphodiesterase
LNYLAHLHLSGQNPEVMVGNFIADAVKGKSHELLSPGIQHGVLLHRFIDDFTDHHAVIKAQVALLRPYAGRWSAVAVDVINDHFLARHFAQFSTLSLDAFTAGTYATLDAFRNQFPPRIQHMYTYMRRDRWLEGYAHRQGIERALLGLSKRVSQPNELYQGFQGFEAQYTELEKLFLDFYPHLSSSCHQYKPPHGGAA